MIVVMEKSGTQHVVMPIARLMFLPDYVVLYFTFMLAARQESRIRMQMWYQSIKLTQS